jgi:hypothetical protein
MEDKEFLQAELLSEFLVVDEADNSEEAVATVTRNPSITWVKFVLTDDKPNANRQRVPADEFDNLITSGTNMPIKVAQGSISNGHDGSFPIGVISHLKKHKDQIIGLAALWERERPEDVRMIKEKYSKREPLELSWEILYADSATTEDGITDLKNTALRAVTFVGRPAFEGRTPVLAVAEKTENTLEDTNLEELDTLKKRVEELESLISDKDIALSSANAELETLREFKTGIEKAREEAEKLDSIKAKFSQAGIVKDETYFVENKQTLLALSNELLEFMIQELVAFASVSQKESVASNINDRVQAPDLSGRKAKDFSPAELGAMLRNKIK